MVTLSSVDCKRQAVDYFDGDKLVVPEELKPLVQESILLYAEIDSEEHPKREQLNEKLKKISKHNHGGIEYLKALMSFLELGRGLPDLKIEKSNHSSSVALASNTRNEAAHTLQSFVKPLAVSSEAQPVVENIIKIYQTLPVDGDRSVLAPHLKELLALPSIDTSYIKDELFPFLEAGGQVSQLIGLQSADATIQSMPAISSPAIEVQVQPLAVSSEAQPIVENIIKIYQTLSDDGDRSVLTSHVKELLALPSIDTSFIKDQLFPFLEAGGQVSQLEVDEYEPVGTDYVMESVPAEDELSIEPASPTEITASPRVKLAVPAFADESVAQPEVQRPRLYSVACVANTYGRLRRYNNVMQQAGMHDANGNWNRGDGFGVFMGNFLLTRNPEGMKILKQLALIKKQAADQRGRFEYLAGSTEWRLFRFFMKGDRVLDPKNAADFFGICELDEFMDEQPYMMSASSVARNIEAGNFNREEILSNMRNSNEGKQLLEAMCDSKLCHREGDTLFVNSEPSQKMLAYVADYSVDVLNGRFSALLTKSLLDGDDVFTEKGGFINLPVLLDYSLTDTFLNGSSTFQDYLEKDQFPHFSITTLERIKAFGITSIVFSEPNLPRDFEYTVNGVTFKNSVGHSAHEVKTEADPEDQPYRQMITSEIAEGLAKVLPPKLLVPLMGDNCRYPDETKAKIFVLLATFIMVAGEECLAGDQNLTLDICNALVALCPYYNTLNKHFGARDFRLEIRHLGRALSQNISPVNRGLLRSAGLNLASAYKQLYAEPYEIFCSHPNPNVVQPAWLSLQAQPLSEADNSESSVADTGRRSTDSLGSKTVKAITSEQPSFGGASEELLPRSLGSMDDPLAMPSQSSQPDWGNSQENIIPQQREVSPSDPITSENAIETTSLSESQVQAVVSLPPSVNHPAPLVDPNASTHILPRVESGVSGVSFSPAPLVDPNASTHILPRSESVAPSASDRESKQSLSQMVLESVVAPSPDSPTVKQAVDLGDLQRLAEKPPLVLPDEVYNHPKTHQAIQAFNQDNKSLALKLLDEVKSNLPQYYNSISILKIRLKHYDNCFVISESENQFTQSPHELRQAIQQVKSSFEPNVIQIKIPPHLHQGLFSIRYAMSNSELNNAQQLANDLVQQYPEDEKVINTILLKIEIATKLNKTITFY